MKLLLTSAGLTTNAIADELRRMIGNGNAKVGLVTTAANVEPGNKDWYINQLTSLQKFGFDWIDIVDISAPGVDWQERLSQVGVVFVSGGNTFHLLDQVRLTGFDKWLQARLNDIVYVGVSAGSILVTPSIAIASVDDGDPNLPGITDLDGLSYVNFEVSPHTPEMVSVKGNADYAATIERKLYAYNDRSAISIVDGAINLILDGELHEFN